MKSTVTLRTLSFALLVTVCVAFVGVTTSAQRRRRPPAKPAKHLTICGNPNVSCVTSLTFEPYALPFQMPPSSVIYDTEFFYAVILKTVSTANNNCDNYIPEQERLTAQTLFPNQKVFASRCAAPGEVSYSDTTPIRISWRCMPEQRWPTRIECSRLCWQRENFPAQTSAACGRRLTERKKRVRSFVFSFRVHQGASHSLQHQSTK